MRYQILEWDTEFFGKRIAKIECGLSELGRAKTQIESFFNEGGDLIYLFSDSELTNLGSNAFLVDKKRSYVLVPDKSNVPTTTPDIVTSFTGNAQQLYSLALQAGVHSRYKIDSHFSNEDFERLYRKWIDSSLNENFADYVLITEESQPLQNIPNITGFITAKIKGKTGELSIGLFATDEFHRGKGIGSALIQGIINIAVELELKVEVTTQADNLTACQFYQNKGFKLDKEEFVYHIWNPNLLNS